LFQGSDRCTKPCGISALPWKILQERVLNRHCPAALPSRNRFNSLAASFDLIGPSSDGEWLFACSRQFVHNEDFHNPLISLYTESTFDATVHVASLRQRSFPIERNFETLSAPLSFLAFNPAR
jgi:hypothetical protein